MSARSSSLTARPEACHRGMAERADAPHGRRRRRVGGIELDRADLEPVRERSDANSALPSIRGRLPEVDERRAARRLCCPRRHPIPPEDVAGQPVVARSAWRTASLRAASPVVVEVVPGGGWVATSPSPPSQPAAIARRRTIRTVPTRLVIPHGSLPARARRCRRGRFRASAARSLRRRRAGRG